MLLISLYTLSGWRTRSGIWSRLSLIFISSLSSFLALLLSLIFSLLLRLLQWVWFITDFLVLVLFLCLLVFLQAILDRIKYQVLSLQLAEAPWLLLCNMKTPRIPGGVLHEFLKEFIYLLKLFSYTRETILDPALFETATSLYPLLLKSAEFLCDLFRLLQLLFQLLALIF